MPQPKLSAGRACAGLPFYKHIPTKADKNANDNKQKEETDKLVAFGNSQFCTGKTAECIGRCHGQCNGPNDFSFNKKQANGTEVGSQVYYFGMSGGV